MNPLVAIDLRRFITQRNQREQLRIIGELVPDNPSALMVFTKSENIRGALSLW